MMAEFAGRDDDWGLQAIVGGSNGGFCSDFTATTISAGADACYGVLEVPKDYHHDLLFSFPDLFQTAAMFTDELEELYKPFYPVSDSSSPAENVPFPPISVPNETKEEPEEIGKKQTNYPDQPPVNSPACPYVPKYKRGKNQQKRVVLQVTAEDLSSDKWAWRKYGQKPIKGSPYPRSYYRCSSSKGCLARKQVEQSCSDPGIFIITYTAEHSHSQPTRKNSLAGTIRHKFPGSKNSARSNIKAAKSKDSGASCSTTSGADVLPPRTPLIASVENESRQRNIEQESNEETIGKQITDEGDDNNIVISGIKLEDDFFSGLEDLDGLISELANYGHIQLKSSPVSSISMKC